MGDSLGDRMKRYEDISRGKVIWSLPIILRLDGKAFHSFTRGMDRPYDKFLANTMKKTTGYLMGEVSGHFAYTQSDEISILIYAVNYDSQVWFDGNRDKIISVSAAMCSVYFNKEFQSQCPNKSAVFDCRAFALPNWDEVKNYFLWRELDAVRNSIQALAQSQFSHSRLQGLNCNQLQEILHQEKGINWNDCPVEQKRGIYLRKNQREIENLEMFSIREFSPEKSSFVLK